MSGTVHHFWQMANGDQLAADIANRYQSWQSMRNKWETERKELRDYLFATDTTKTTNSQLPWKNKTTTPKLTQIRDNLHANYVAALFSNPNWLTWKARDQASASKQKTDAIVNYMLNKLEQSGFEETVARLLLDYIDYGNAFAQVVFEDETHVGADGEIISVYRGPRLKRISPYDITFNAKSDSFRESPKITRYLVSIGQLKAKAMEGGEGWEESVIERCEGVRDKEWFGRPEINKSQGMEIDGFGTISEYLQSGMVEILEFEGNVYDEERGEYEHGVRILVADRSFVAYRAPLESWSGVDNKHHVGWRKRPDNLYAMGPLDNLVGMQYRIDHLENLRADVFDQIATPVVFERGAVNDWDWGPNERIQGDENSDVRVLAPDATALNADFQIQNLMATMEEMAGAPKQAMGIRTPGEKTAFEVQTLQNAAGRIFQVKVTQFEKEFLEPILNQMLEVARRYMDESEVIRVEDADFGAVEFLTITRADIAAKGQLVPRGARHFAERAQAVQTLNSLVQSGIYQDPDVQVHFSSRELARMARDLLDLPGTENLVRDFVRISERAEAATMAQAAQRQALETAGTLPEDEV